MAKNSKTTLPKSIEWLGHTIIGYATKEQQLQVWKMVLDYEKNHQTILRSGNKNNVILTHPANKEWTRPISFGAFLEVFGISRYTEKGNGGYHPRQAKAVLESVGYNLIVSPSTATKQTLAKACPKCKEQLPNKATFCWKCGHKQPEVEAVKGKAVVKAEVKPVVKAKKVRKPKPNIANATLIVEPKPEAEVSLPDLPEPFGESEHSEVYNAQTKLAEEME